MLPGGGAPRLPTPTALSLTPTVPDPTKKSHARKRPPGHVPRPRNAFILFRCDFVRQQTIPHSVERDHRNLSRIAGMMWRGMTEEMRKPWMAMAEREKREHAERWPEYRYKPEGLVGPKRKVKLTGAGEETDGDEEFEVGGDDDEYDDRRVRGGRGRERETLALQSTCRIRS
ncbi:HMG-box [Hymenopellis radicata]|nr:HMG-box [Hymenopellis radicata]